MRINPRAIRFAYYGLLLIGVAGNVAIGLAGWRDRDSARVTLSIAGLAAALYAWAFAPYVTD